MKFNIKILFLLIPLFLFCIEGFPQRVRRNITVQQYNTGWKCSDKLDEAINFYNNGLYFESERLLKEIDNDKCYFTKSGKQEVLEYLVKNQLEMDKVYERDSTIYRLLNNNPHYELKDEGTADFNNLINKFDIHPLWTIGARNAGLHPSFKITKTFSALDNTDYNASYDNAKKFITEYYGFLEYGLNSFFSINVEATLQKFAYSRDLKRDLSKIYPQGIDSNRALHYSELINFIEFPVYLKFSTANSRYTIFGTSKTTGVVLYTAIGISYLRMLHANAAASLTYTKEDIYTGEKAIINSGNEDIDVSSMRTKNNFEAIGEAGFGYKYRNLKICFYYRYFKGLNSITNPAHRFDNPLLLYTYSYIDDGVVLNKYELGATISYVFKNKIKKR